MSLKIGIVGLPNVGKSTLFHALTQKNVDTSNYPFATIEPNVGIVEVPDGRLCKLSAFSKSAKTIPAVIEFIDIAGLVKGAHNGEGLGNKFLAHIREVDAVCQLVRNFEDPKIHHVETTIEPERDREIIETELLMADLQTVEKAEARAERDAKAGGKDAKMFLESVVALKKKIQAAERPDGDTLDTARNLRLLSAKPVLLVHNVKDAPRVTDEKGALSLNIKFEEELSCMTKTEQEELGEKSRLPELIKSAYSLLGLISYFTTGKDESRAWTVPRGSTAKRAGRAIHSDFEDKFIRAEVIYWEDLLNAGSYAKARELGKLRTEGKDYIVSDGDVIEFKI